MRKISVREKKKNLKNVKLKKSLSQRTYLVSQNQRKISPNIWLPYNLKPLF